MATETTRPKAIQAQEDEADRMLAQLQQAREAEAAEAAQAVQQTVDAAVAPPAEPPAADTTQGAQDAPPVTDGAQPDTAQTQAPPQPTEDVAGLKAELDRREQALRVLQGKYNAEVPRYAEQLRDLSEMVTHLRQELAAARGAGNRQAPADAAPAADQPVDLKKLFSAKDIEDFGEPLLKAAAQAADALARQRARELVESMVAEKVAPVQQTVQQTQRQMFFASLDTSVPTWRTLNTDAAFNEWLNGVVPEAGVTRRDLLNDAVAGGDTQRAAHFFRAFGSACANGAPPTTANGQPAAKPVPLGSQVSPRKTPVAPPPTTQQNGKVWGRVEIAAVYDKHAKGEIDSATFKKIEADIDRAWREGRVRE